MCIKISVATHHEILRVCKTYIPDEVAVLWTSSVPVKKKAECHSLHHYDKR
jgi:hypothetical protein